MVARKNFVTQLHPNLFSSVDLALLNQQQSPTATHSGTAFPMAPVGGAGSLGNLSSAMLSVSNSSAAPGPKSLGMTGSESLMSAYLGMPTAQQQLPAACESGGVVCSGGGGGS